MVALAFLAPLAILVRELAADRELSAAERDAQAVARLVAVVDVDGAPDVIGAVLVGGGSFDGRATTVVLADGTIVGASLDEGEDLTAALGGSTFRQPVSTGEAVYVPVLGAEGQTAVVRVVAGGDAMTAGVTRTWVTLALLGVTLVMMAVAIADRLGRAVVRPVDELASAADRLGSGELETRVDVKQPKELAKVGAAFNRLASQISLLLQQERETAADLSHRLRTPLTALRLNVDGLPDGVDKERLNEQIDEIERVVDHIISEARRPNRQARNAESDVRDVVADRVAFWDALATDEGRHLDRRLDAEHVRVPISEHDLTAAFDAVIGNVFSHTEPGVELRVSVATDSDDFVDVIVEDGGTGFTDAQVVERGASGGGSTGLGLDIARRTAEFVNGALLLGRSDLGGAKVVMHLPLADRL